VRDDAAPAAAPAAPRPDHGEDNSPAEPQDLPRNLPQDLSPERGRPEPGDLPPRDDGDDDDLAGLGNERCAALAAGLSAELAREEAAVPPAPTSPAAGSGQAPGALPWDEGALPLLPLQPPRTGRDLLAEHVTAMVCCAAMDTIGAAPALDWLDGPALLINGERAADLAPRVRALVEDGDPVPLRTWLVDSGIRPEKPVRLV
jgi:hypothetical protein